jgi:hypothetical protein
MAKLLHFQSRGIQNWGKWLMAQHEAHKAKRQRELLERIAAQLHGDATTPLEAEPSGPQAEEQSGKTCRLESSEWS